VEFSFYPGREADSFLAVVNAELPGEQIRERYDMPINGATLQRATASLRRELTSVVFYEAQQAGESFYPFCDLNSLSVDEAIARRALVSLARVGHEVWRLLFNGPRTPAGLKQVAAGLRSLPHGSALRIVLDSPQFIIPWALLYDKPGPINAETLDWEGFWGYRYILDVLPPGRYPPAVISDPALCLQLLLSDAEELHDFTSEQERFVQRELGGASARIARGVEEILRSLAPPCEAAVLYFYCHGQHQGDAELPGDAALLFGSNEGTRLADLRLHMPERMASRPLVLLNSCAGAAQEPFYYDGFMPFFIEEQGARGFIGTEVKAPQLLAHDLALQFMRSFVRGRSVGAILWRLRRHYLRTHNTILAFNYSLYGLSDTRLAPPSQGDR
jgi:hypothetical protein